MLTNNLIYALEIVTAMLVMLLTVQIFRCYRAEQQQRESITQGLQTLANQSSGTSISTVVPIRSDDEIVPQLNDPLKVDYLDVAGELGAEVVPVQTRVSPSTDILNDYIGGFFDAPEPANIQAFKATESPLAVKAESADLVEELEEDIIMVAAEDNEPFDKDKVMSDKVVHAMLDEAKLVCAS